MIISATLFAVGHLGQGSAAASTTFFTAIGLQYFVMISGGLYMAIALHFIHNAVYGIVYGALFKRKSEGVITEELVANDADMAVTVGQTDRSWHS